MSDNCVLSVRAKVLNFLPNRLMHLMITPQKSAMRSKSVALNKSGIYDRNVHVRLEICVETGKFLSRPREHDQNLCLALGNRESTVAAANPTWSLGLQFIEILVQNRPLILLVLFVDFVEFVLTFVRNQCSSS